MQKGQDLLMVVLQRIDLKYKTSLESRRGLLVKFLKCSCYRVSNPKPKTGENSSSLIEKPTCGKCAKRHFGDCLKGTNSFFSCSKSFHKVRA